MNHTFIAQDLAIIDLQWNKWWVDFHREHLDSMQQLLAILEQNPQ
jgi:hypothetical protein